MSKQESTIMKGVAILMMLFFHLFVYRNIDGESAFEPIFYYIARANNPVPFYIILSGYGMYFVTKKGDDHRFSRIIKLYLRYWIITGTFVIISYLLGDYRCLLTPYMLVGNITGLSTTYNPVLWFILPYTILELLCPLIIKIVDGIRIRYSLLIFYSVYLISAYLTKYQFFRTNILQSFYIVFPFVIGMLLAKTNFIKVIKTYFIKRHWCLPWLLLFLVCITRCFLYTGAVISFYAAIFIVLFLSARRPVWIDKSLLILGHNSTNMWMIHTWLIDLLFATYAHQLDFSPILKFIVIVVITFVLSVVFNHVFKPIDKLITRFC
jgi:surface polysaccharide O-acyltransferase-like enzyme